MQETLTAPKPKRILLLNGIKNAFDTSKVVIRETLDRIKAPSMGNSQSFSFRPIPQDFSIEVCVDKILVKSIEEDKTILEVNTPRESVRALKIIKQGTGIVVEFSME